MGSCLGNTGGAMSDLGGGPGWLVRYAGAWLGLVLVLVLFAGAGCSAEVDLQPCDIREAGCQDDIFLAVQRARGSVWDPWAERPAMRVISAADFRRELLDAEQAAAEAPDAPYDYFEAAQELLGLLDPERTSTASVDARVDNVAAYYSYADRGVTIVDHGDAGDLVSATSVLAHELVHAAQDRELGLGWFSLPSTRDGSNARQAIIEGEARLYENLVMLDVRGLSVDGVDWNGYHERLLTAARGRVFESTSPGFQLYGLLYPLGARYLTARYLRGGNTAVRDVWGNLPRQVVSIVRQDGKRRSEWQCGVPEEPDGYTYRTDTALGALNLYGIATRWVDDESAAWRVAEAWAGDQLFLYSLESEETALIWELLVDAELAAEATDWATDFYGEAAVLQRAEGHLSIRLFTGSTEPQWPEPVTCLGGAG